MVVLIILWLFFVVAFDCVRYHKTKLTTTATMTGFSKKNPKIGRHLCLLNHWKLDLNTSNFYPNTRLNHNLLQQGLNVCKPCRYPFYLGSNNFEVSRIYTDFWGTYNIHGFFEAFAQILPTLWNAVSWFTFLLIHPKNCVTRGIAVFQKTNAS